MLSGTEPRVVLIVGCGYTGRRLALRLAPHCEVVGWVASTESVRALEVLGLSAQRVDLDRAERLPLEPRWLEGTALCYLAPPPHHGDIDTRLAHLLALLPEQPRTLLYMSTTGVYGDRGGAEVSETTPIRPSTSRALRRADAERQVTAWSARTGNRAVILRVPGIYGPGRLPLERLRRGEPVIRGSDSGSGNRIHVDDLVTACVTALKHPDARGIYNVGDGNPATTSEFFTRVALLAGLPPPRQVDLEEARRVLSPAMLSFAGESRRVSTARICRELGFAPRYASLDEGIRASLAESE
jgi:nucleoside-diphosphate-sugar epimerase